MVALGTWGASLTATAGAACESAPGCSATAAPTRVRDRRL